MDSKRPKIALNLINLLLKVQWAKAKNRKRNQQRNPITKNNLLKITVNQQ